MKKFLKKTGRPHCLSRHCNCFDVHTLRVFSLLNLKLIKKEHPIGYSFFIGRGDGILFAMNFFELCGSYRKNSIARDFTVPKANRSFWAATTSTLRVFSSRKKTRAPFGTLVFWSR